MSELELSVAFNTAAVARVQNPEYTVKGLGVTNFSEEDSRGRIQKFLRDIASDDVVANAVEREASNHVKIKSGQKFLSDAEVKSKKAALQELTGQKVVLEGNANNEWSTLTLKIPLRGSRADLNQLQLAWTEGK